MNLTSAESRALSLLGQGLIPEQVAGACGLSPSRISQLLSDEQFAAAVAEQRFQNLSKHNDRDNAYDSLEDTLLERMKDCLPLMMRPGEILKAIQVINGAKRRGQLASQTEQHLQVINLVLPTAILQQFQLNAANQVVSVQDSTSSESRPLVTIQSGTLLNKAKAKENTNVLPSLSRPSRTLSAEDF
jgi:transcriptional regulator with XRE-family HTH domain